MHRLLGYFVLTASIGAAIASDGPCVFKGECGSGGVFDASVPCVAEGEVTQTNRLNATGHSALMTYCRDFLDPDGEFCCNENQVNMLVDQYGKIALFLAQCPSCSFNMARIFCHLTCSPRQRDFIKVTEVKNATKESIYGTKQVGRISFFMDEDYIDRTYTSCKGVQNSQTQGMALKAFCAPFPVCSPKNLLTAMGTGPFTPFKMDFKYEATPENTLFNHNTTKCSEAPYAGQLPCGCGDCQDACPPFEVPDDAPPFCILGLDGFYFVFVLVFIVLIAAFEVFWILKARSSGSASQNDETELFRSSSVQEAAKGPSLMKTCFHRLGVFCASRPWTVIAIGTFVCILCSLGNLNFHVTTDPVELWSAPTSISRTQRDYYNKHLKPFYRIEQVIILNKGGTPFTYVSNVTQQSYEFSPVFEKSFLLDLLALQNKITSLTGSYDNGTSVEKVHLEDICFSPMGNGKCAIQSAPNWFQNNASLILDNPELYRDHIINCIDSPTLVAQQDSILGIGCLGEYGGPSFSFAALGGYDEDKPLLAPAAVLTFLVDNHEKAEDNRKAVAWEEEYIRFLKNFTHPNMTIAFTSENSITSELNLESRSDVSTIAVSYLLMFLYVSVVLGRYKTFATALIHSQIVLGAMGVFLVLASVASSVGVFSFLGIPSTLIIFEVVPFLVLAIGVDNIFIMVQAYQRSTRLDGESLEEHVGRIMGLVGPSMLLASASEVTCFFLGALTNMPAVRTFALYAALALLIDVLLQMTVFVSMLTLDIKRQESKRLDLLCCVGASPEADAEPSVESTLFRFMKNVYSPLLKIASYRNAVFVIFIAIFCVSASVVPKLDVGLEQDISMPRGSYLQDYFRFLKDLLRAGPPVYFVVGDKYNYSSAINQNLIGSFLVAENSSLVNDLRQAARSKDKTLVAAPPMSWIDDFFGWTEECCFEQKDTHAWCPEKEAAGCVSCPKDDIGRPPSMTSHIQDFLDTIPSLKCGKGGRAAFKDSVELIPNSANPGEVEIGATSFMTYHTVLKDSSDYIKALKMARYVANRIETQVKQGYEGNKDDVEIFPYSIIYVYYEQYLNIWNDVAFHLALSFAGVLVITLLLMKFRILPTIAVGVSILMIVVDLMGVMYFVDIPLNAISLVNLVMCVGISVEFCSHIVKAFVEDDEACPIDRAINAVKHTGSSVLSGITCTKFIGVMVLFFAKSQLFVVFYFRMYLGIVLVGSIHGLVFLPVFLATFGAPKPDKRGRD